MANKMLIDATHPEETRVVVLRGNRVEEFDFETAHRKQLRGNIYLAKVTRVEPSLQAAFIDYGGNRHGFLAFSEIHPDYYQIPVADRQALLDADARAHDEDEADEEPRRGGGGSSGGGNRRRGRGRNRHREARRHDSGDDAVRSDAPHPDAPQPDAHNNGHDGDSQLPAPQSAWDVPSETSDTVPTHHDNAPASDTPHSEDLAPVEASRPDRTEEPIGETANPPVPAEIGAENPLASQPDALTQSADDREFQAERNEAENDDHRSDAHADESQDDAHAFQSSSSDHDEDDEEDDEEEEEEIVDTVGGADAIEEVMERAPRYRRQYKIQEVIKRRQVMLVQVVKEERGTKGAALTTYLSLAGRYSVLMPNTARGGGISRKITSGEDRKRLREIAEELDVPEGMGVILRTAGASRSKEEVRRDFEYLMRLWETVRDLTLRSSAPTLVYEEGSLVKRSIRDLYSKDIEEIVVAGDNGYRDAKDFMRMLMPSHARNVKAYRDTQPVFARYGIESQLDAMFSPNVQLRSGGYIVINQTEALVAIDVNSGRSTREHHIEDTALKTNCEAAEEVARQLRLRDLAGLIVIDFIDMDEKRNNRTVERRLKDALRNDRARIQVGRISHFGLMEMSRQRIRTSVLESSTEKCEHCGGTGHVRSVSSVSLQLLRALEETMQKGATHNMIVRTRPDTALYVLNHKRAHLRALEERFQITITIDADATINGTVTYAIDRGEQVMTAEQAKAIADQHAARPMPIEEEEPELEADFEADEIEEAPEPVEARFSSDDDGDEDEPEQAGEREENEEGREGGRKRRRRRRGRGGSDRNGESREREDGDRPVHARSETSEPRDDVQPGEARADGDEPTDGETPRHADADGENGSSEARRRRRGRRGGRRNRRDRTDSDLNGSTPDGTTLEATGESHPYEAPQQPYPAAPDIAQDTPVPVSRAAEPQPEAEAAPVAQQPVTQAAPRRRSTVREPAPSAATMETLPPQAMQHEATPAVPEPAPAVATPAPSEPEAAAPDTKPRRTGWWAKRLLGGDK